ncbi:MAG TPA: VOC family protein [Ktedonobacteraceae bacterium]|nr:VOC family protein [Ktedonobacteraceae bacterium]
MKLVNFRLLVSDFPASLAFWRDIMMLPITFGDETMGYAYFDTGNAGIELLSRVAFAASLGELVPSIITKGNPAVIVFRVDDVDATYDDLVKRGAKAVVEPVDRPAWQARTAHISDPDGYLVEIYSQLQTGDGAES